MMRYQKTYDQLNNISEVLQNQNALHTYNEHYKNSEIENFKGIPIILCGVKRIFSQYKNIIHYIILFHKSSIFP